MQSFYWMQRGMFSHASEGYRRCRYQFIFIIYRKLLHGATYGKRKQWRNSLCSIRGGVQPPCWISAWYRWWNMWIDLVVILSSYGVQQLHVMQWCKQIRYLVAKKVCIQIDSGSLFTMLLKRSGQTRGYLLCHVAKLFNIIFKGLLNRSFVVFPNLLIRLLNFPIAFTISHCFEW